MKTALFVFILVVLYATSWAAQIHIGTSEISITPDRPVAIEGAFRLRVAKAVASPITANVIALESRNGNKIMEQSIMVSADLVHLPMELVYGVRKAVAKLIPGLNTSNIYISTTHTHSAPVVMRGNFVIPDGVMRIEEYNQFFIERVSQAVASAYRSLQPGSVAWGLGHAHTAYNRRTAYRSGRARMYGPLNTPDYKGPEGAEYQGVPTIFFFDQTNRPIAAAVNVWSPAQEGEGGNNRIGADFWHPVRVNLKKQFGPDFVVAGLCGPAGDQSPLRRYHAAAEDRMRQLRGISWLEEFGRRISETVIETYDLIKNERHLNPVLKHHAEVMQLPGWEFTESDITRIQSEHDNLKKELANHPERADRLSRPISWRAQTLERYHNLVKSGDWTYPSEVHVIRLGDVAISTSQFELFTEFGLRILARSEAHLNCVVQLTGPAYYLPTAEAMQGGAYSAIPETGAVSPDGGQVLVNKTVERITDLFNEIEINLPESGRLTDGNPVGEGWRNLLATSDDWHMEDDYWKLDNGVLSGESTGGKYHFAWTKETFKDFELHAVVSMTGPSANSGVCIRLRPDSPQHGPGYQVDMGQGYWGSLWDENEEKVVQQFPVNKAHQLTRNRTWHHFYIAARGHHIQSWLNGMKTIDIVHKEGFPDGSIGFELCHGKKHTVLTVQTLAVRELK